MISLMRGEGSAALQTPPPPSPGPSKLPERSLPEPTVRRLSPCLFVCLSVCSAELPPGDALRPEIRSRALLCVDVPATKGGGVGAGCPQEKPTTSAVPLRELWKGSHWPLAAFLPPGGIWLISFVPSCRVDTPIGGDHVRRVGRGRERGQG